MARVLVLVWVHTAAWTWCTQHMWEIGYKEKIIRNNNNNNKINYSSWVVHQTILPGTHMPLTGVNTPHLDCGTSQYFSCCFSLVFLEGYYPSSSPAVISLCLDPMTWDPSALSKRMAFSSSISSWSCWRYSNILFFFSFFSSIFCLLAFSLAFFSAFLLAFWAICSA